MKRLQNAQKKVNEITLTYMAINGVLAKMIDSSNTVKQVEGQLVQVGKLLDRVATLTNEVVEDITLGTPEAISEMMKEGRYE